jgi:glycosyltransferase involved in cell wall biosynthesis
MEFQAVFYDPGLSGHHPAYLARMLRACARSGRRIGFASSPHLRSRPEIGAVIKDYPNLIFPLKGGDQSAVCGNHILQNFSWWRAARNWHQDFIAEHSTERFVLPYLDYFLYATSIVGSPFGAVATYALSMRAPAPSDTLIGRLKRKAFVRLVKRPEMRRVMLIDEGLSKQLSDIPTSVSHKIAYLADPADARQMPYDSARHSLGIPHDAFVVLMFGAISQRKGIDTLIAALRSPAIDGRAMGLIVGEPDQSARQAIEGLLEGSEETLKVVPRYVSEDEQAAYFSACDCVWLVYEDHLGMSGVQILAGMYGKAVIACNQGLIGRYTAEYSLGHVIKPRDVTGAIAAINRLASHRSEREHLGGNGLKTFAHHSEEAFSQSFLNLVFGVASKCA